MNIIIAGCGNVGKLLASRLAAEEHNITVIDTNPDVLTGIEDEIDALTVQGDAADVEVLKAAGMGFENVVKTTCFLSDIANFAAFNEVYAKYFVSRPARSCVAVKDIPKGALCEIEIVAVR